MGLIAKALVERFGGFYLPVLAILAVALVVGLAVSLLAVREKACVPLPPVSHSSVRARLHSMWMEIRSPFASSDCKARTAYDLFHLLICFACAVFWVFWTRFLMMSGIASVRGFLQYWMEDVVQKPYNLLGWILPDAKAATSMFLLPLLVGATVAALLAGALSDRFGRKLLVYLSGAIQAATAIGMIFLPNMNAGSCRSPMCVQWALTRPRARSGGAGVVLWARVWRVSVGGFRAGRRRVAGPGNERQGSGRVEFEFHVGQHFRTARGGPRARHVQSGGSGPLWLAAARLHTHAVGCVRHVHLVDSVGGAHQNGYVCAVPLAVH